VDPKNPFPKRSENPFPPSGDAESDLNSTIEEFFSRLQSDARRPAPSPEAVSAARQAIQRLAAESMGDESFAASEQNSANLVCASCGHANPSSNQYCAACGIALEMSPLDTPSPEPIGSPANVSPSLPPGQHHYHHHYHHHYFAGGADSAFAAPRAAASDPVASRVRAPGGQSMSRAETAVRKVMQDWAAAVNNRRLDDLVSTYTADALVLRPNHPAVRGAGAIREFFFAALDSGFGDVELDPMRLDVVGDVAYEAGRCKMLVPVAVSKRREEKGKYLSLLTRKSNGEWGIACDCWSTDLSIAGPIDAETHKPGISAGAPMKTVPPRKS